MRPWPEVPCHPCRCANHHPKREPYEDFCEADGYYWHSAGWNRSSRKQGRMQPWTWFAVCCEGHIVKGKRRSEP